MAESCYACGRKLGKKPRMVDTRDAQLVLVGVECGKMVDRYGEAGWQPPQGGPKLYPHFDANGKKVYVSIPAN